MRRRALRLFGAAGSFWGIGIALAGALHLGAAGALLIGLQPPLMPDSEELAGAVMVELDATPMEQEAQPEETASATPAEDRPATRDLAERLSARRDDDLPTEQASADRPREEDLHFAQEKTREQKQDASEEEQATEAMKRQEAQQASLAAAASPQQADAGEREETHAREIGSKAEAERRVLETWQRALVAELARNRRYPAEARSQRQEGEALIRFRLARDGHVLAASLVRSSGHRVLDAEALEMLTRGGALPPPPAHVGAADLALTLPVRFRLKGV